MAWARETVKELVKSNQVDLYVDNRTVDRFIHRLDRVRRKGNPRFWDEQTNGKKCYNTDLGKYGVEVESCSCSHLLGNDI